MHVKSLSCHRESKGFSLIELTIVVIITALLIGGIITGQSLMRAAELRSVMRDYERYISAIRVFQDKYSGLPGDLHDATDLWGEAHPTPASCRVTASTGHETCDGNGNGRIEWIAGSNEVMRFWQHLANAGLIEGHYTGVGGPGGITDTIVGQNVPMSGIAHVGYSTLHVTGAPHFSFFDVKPGNVLFLGSEQPGFETSGPFLTVTEAYSLDRKIDDGKPGMGYVHVKPWWACTDATAGSDLTSNYKTDFTGDEHPDDEVECSFIFPQAF